MLGHRGDLGVGRLNGGAERGGRADGARVTLESAEDQCVDHGAGVAGGLGIGKGLVSGGLLEAGQIGNRACASSGGLEYLSVAKVRVVIETWTYGVTEQAEDRVLNASWVVHGQTGADRGDEGFMGVFLWDLTSHKVPTIGEVYGTSRGRDSQGDDLEDLLGLHGDICKDETRYVRKAFKVVEVNKMIGYSETGSELDWQLQTKIWKKE